MAQRTAIVPILLTFVAVTVFWLLSGQDWRALYTTWADDALKLAIWVGFCLGAAVALDRLSWSGGWRSLGLTGPIGPGFGFGLLATLPMMVAVALVGWVGNGLGTVVGGALLGPFAEELLFRGFLFTQLVQSARWRVWPAIFVSAAAFGLAHVPDLSALIAGDLLRVLNGLGTETLTGRLTDVLPFVGAQAAGGVLFAWVYHRWGSLWPAVGLHSFINLWWILIAGSEPVRYLGDTIWLPQVAQALTVGLAILLTVRWRQGRFEQ